MVPNFEISQNSDTSALYTSGRKWLYRRVRRSCRQKLLFKRIPILTWLPNYRKEYVVSDLVAGITVGLTVIPQAIAYANVAGLPLQYGLYSSFMACFVYTIFGSWKDVPVGPTAIAAILTRETLQKAHLGPDFAILLCFISGCVSLLMGTLQLGFLLDFISGPVSVGFTSAASIIIATSQVKDILGLKVSGTKFVQVWQNIFEHIGETRRWDTTLGIVCIIVLLLLRKVKDLPVMPKNTKVPSRLQQVITKSFWLISTARNIIIVILCAVMCWLLEKHLGKSPVILTGHVKQGLPEFQLPPFEAQVGNETYTFIDMISALSTGCLVVPMLSLLETISIAKVFLLIFCFKWKKTAAEAHRMLVEVYESTPSNKTCRKWFRRFQSGNFDVEDKERSGRPKAFEEEELQALVDEDPCNKKRGFSIELWLVMKNGSISIIPNAEKPFAIQVTIDIDAKTQYSWEEGHALYLRDQKDVVYTMSC
ncbi:PREDICTED: sodium-independent sulfate anion transporter-like [Cyphomyrmex costatus]|uniref:sodium-independent sulfate anion transporter-like n=1 Tax=Cyphomyrmex costatus TaxID=456900 RepID=UPI00085221F1|nr:PREDICTED: sodium-independent sulfate anion transporter-like [Cyphomyrmex costatus]